MAKTKEEKPGLGKHLAEYKLTPAQKDLVAQIDAILTEEGQGNILAKDVDGFKDGTIALARDTYTRAIQHFDSSHKKIEKLEGDEKKAMLGKSAAALLDEIVVETIAKMEKNHDAQVEIATYKSMRDNGLFEGKDLAPHRMRYLQKLAGTYLGYDDKMFKQLAEQIQGTFLAGDKKVYNMLVDEHTKKLSESIIKAKAGGVQKKIESDPTLAHGATVHYLRTLDEEGAQPVAASHAHRNPLEILDLLKEYRSKKTAAETDLPKYASDNGLKYKDAA